MRYLVYWNNTITTHRLKIFQSNPADDDVAFRKDLIEHWGLVFKEVVVDKPVVGQDKNIMEIYKMT